MALANKNVHFVGVGGCGMSGLVRMVRQQGAACSGSDLKQSEVIDQLRREGYPIALHQSANTVPPNCDLLIYSAAVSDSHPEVVEANRRRLPIMKYAQAIGQLMLDRTGVAIAGTHGKSTTTSMLSHILIHAGLDPSLIVGAHCGQIGGGWRCGQGNLLVVEACEYDRSFLNLQPTHAVILNVEADHLDVYDSIDQIVGAFTLFASKLPVEGTLLIHHETPHRQMITAALDCTVQTIGFTSDADWHLEVEPPVHCDQGTQNRKPKVQLFEYNQSVVDWISPLPGDHMAFNSAVAAVTAHQLGAPWPAISEALASFRGLERRMQRLGQRTVREGLVTVVDDYGHHPTEIAATLIALRQHESPKRLICVFQPHQHSRTRFLLDDFSSSFGQADIVIIPDIYFVRDSEHERQSIMATDLVERLCHRKIQAMYLRSFEAITAYLKNHTRAGDLVVTMGAGDVWKVAQQFLNPRPN